MRPIGVVKAKGPTWRAAIGWQDEPSIQTQIRPFRYFNLSPEVIRLVAMMYVRFPLSLRNVEDLLVERGIDFCHDTVRLWWNRFGPLFAADIRASGWIGCGGFASGAGTSTKSSSGSTASAIICDVRLNTRAKSSNLSSRRNAIKQQL